MTSSTFGVFALVWPFVAVAFVVASVFAVHWLLDRRDRRHQAAE
jgi:hypothetical protein